MILCFKQVLNFMEKKLEVGRLKYVEKPKLIHPTSNFQLQTLGHLILTE